MQLTLEAQRVTRMAEELGYTANDLIAGLDGTLRFKPQGVPTGSTRACRPR